MSPLDDDNLINRSLAVRLNHQFEKFNQQYFSSPLENTLRASSNPAPVPIERILLASYGDHLSPISFFGQNNSPVVCDSLATHDGFTTVVACNETVIIFSPRKPETKLVISDIIFSLCLLSPDYLVVFTSSSIILYSAPQGVKLSEHSISETKKTTVNRVTPVSATQMVACTSDDAVYIVSVDITARTISHQLMIAPSESSLGAISAMAFATQERLLAVVGSVSVLILDLAIVDKPKLYFKKSLGGSKTVNEQCLWVANGTRLLLPNRGLALVRTGSGFESQELEPSSYLDQKSLSENLIVCTSDGGRGVTLGELRSDNSVWMLDEYGQSHELPGKDSIVLIPRENRDRNIFLVVGFRSNHTSLTVDLHKAEVMKWIEYVFSLSHSEKYVEAIDLLIQLGEKKIPLLSDNFQALSDQSVIVGIVSKYLKSSEEASMPLIITLASTFRLIEEVGDLFDATSFSPRKSEFLSSLMTMVIQRLVPTSSLTQDIVMRAIEVGGHQIDEFISTVIVRGGMNGEVLVDTNKVVRAATANDWKQSIVLIHTYLLRDYLFPLKYWTLFSDQGIDMDLICYYMYCLSRCRRFPCMEAATDDTNGVIRILITDERQTFEKIFLQSPKDILDCIGWDLMDVVGNISSCKEAVNIYAVKCAIANGQEFDVKLAIDSLIKQSELNLILTILERDAASGVTCESCDLQMVLSQLLEAGSEAISDGQIVKFVTRFHLSTDECVAMCLTKSRSEVAVKLLGINGEIDRAIALIDDEKSFEKRVEMAAWLTSKTRKGEFSLVSLWASLLNDPQAAELVTHNAKAARALACSVDVFNLASKVRAISHKAWLMEVFKSTNRMLQQAVVVSAVDVGTQFAVLANNNSIRGRAISITASICHSCLDPITTSKSNLMIFSCGHIVHSYCGERSVCPVCV